MLRGEHDIAYHYVIERDGNVRVGRPETMPGAHASGYNRHTLGICLIGGRKGKTNLSEDNFTDHQKTSLRSLLDTLTARYEHADAVGHRDLDGVMHRCPGFAVKEFYYDEK